MRDKSNLPNKEEARRRLLGAIFSPTEQVEGMEMTNLFRITDEDKFNSIIEHIQNENGVVVTHKEDKVSIFSNDTICNCVPLEVDKSKVKNYDGNILNTLELLQEILPDNETLILQSTLHIIDKDEISSSILKVTNKNIITI